jgi:hypothetical protein
MNIHAYTVSDEFVAMSAEELLEEMFEPECLPSDSNNDTEELNQPGAVSCMQSVQGIEEQEELAGHAVTVAEEKEAGNQAPDGNQGTSASDAVAEDDEVLDASRAAEAHSLAAEEDRHEAVEEAADGDADVRASTECGDVHESSALAATEVSLAHDDAGEPASEHLVAHSDETVPEAHEMGAASAVTQEEEQADAAESHVEVLADESELCEDAQAYGEGEEEDEQQGADEVGDDDHALSPDELVEGAEPGTEEPSPMEGTETETEEPSPADDDEEPSPAEDEGVATALEASGFAGYLMAEQAADENADVADSHEHEPELEPEVAEDATEAAVAAADHEPWEAKPAQADEDLRDSRMCLESLIDPECSHMQLTKEDSAELRRGLEQQRQVATPGASHRAADAHTERENQGRSDAANASSPAYAHQCESDDEGDGRLTISALIHNADEGTPHMCSSP